MFSHHFSSAAGIAYSRFNRQLGLTISLLGAGVAFVAYPLQRDLYAYYAVDAITSLFAAGVDVGCSAWMLEMWQEDSNTFMLAMSFLLAIGQAVGPFIVTPFLSVTEEFIPENQTITSKSSIRIISSSRIAIPFFITGAIHILSAAVLLAMYYKSPFQQEIRTLHSGKKRTVVMTPTDDDSHEEECREQDEEDTDVMPSSSKCYRIMIIIGGIILSVFYMNTEMNDLTYLPQFLVHLDPPIDKVTATLMISTLYAVFAATFGLTIFISIKVSVRYMLYAYFCLILCGNILLAMFASTSQTMIWLSVVILGMGHSSVSPGIFAFLEQRINVTNAVTGLLMACAAAFSIIMTLVLGHHLEGSPFILIYSNLSSLSICVAVLIALSFSDIFHARKTAETC